MTETSELLPDEGAYEIAVSVYEDAHDRDVTPFYTPLRKAIEAYEAARRPSPGIGESEVSEEAIRAATKAFLEAEGWTFGLDDVKPGTYHASKIELAIKAALPYISHPIAATAGVEVKATHRHKKRGTDYVMIGFGRAAYWINSSVEPTPAQEATMREVAIYRSVDDGSLWVRPREEFEDGRFEALKQGSAE